MVVNTAQSSHPTGGVHFLPITRILISPPMHTYGPITSQFFLSTRNEIVYIVQLSKKEQPKREEHLGRRDPRICHDHLPCSHGQLESNSEKHFSRKHTTMIETLGFYFW